MTIFKRSVYNDPDFMLLVQQLDEDLKIMYGDYQQNFTPLNKMDETVKVLLAYIDGKPVACGAIRPMQEDRTVELKRMFVQPAWRGRGISKQVLQALENWAGEEGYHTIRLETGDNQPAAIGLYLKYGYTITAPFGAYENIEKAICMKKIIA